MTTLTITNTIHELIVNDPTFIALRLLDEVDQPFKYHSQEDMDYFIEKHNKEFFYIHYDLDNKFEIKYYHQNNFNQRLEPVLNNFKTKGKLVSSLLHCRTYKTQVNTLQEATEFILFCLKALL